MANTMAIQDVQPSDRAKVVVYKVTLSGSYVQVSRGTTTGEQLLLNSASNPNNLPDPFFGVRGPDRGYVLQGPGGFSAQILPGATSNQWLLKVYGATNGTELAAGAYGAGLTGDLDFLIAFEGKLF